MSLDAIRNLAAEGNLNKETLLQHYREVARPILDQASSLADIKGRAKPINEGLAKAQVDVAAMVQEIAYEQGWEPGQVLEVMLLNAYTGSVVMLESRHLVWPYEYMALSRRVGELWERFVRVCWQYPVEQGLASYDPPVFDDVRAALGEQLERVVDGLPVEDEDKAAIRSLFETVWSFVSSGGVALGMDEHFVHHGTRYVVDFKSGFGSNEKGNTNRLLLVGSVYKSLTDEYECLVLVRAPRDEGNQYLQKLERSGIWQVCCGEEAYRQIEGFTAFNLLGWIEANVNWTEDLLPDVARDLREGTLGGYLDW